MFCRGTRCWALVVIALVAGTGRATAQNYELEQFIRKQNVQRLDLEFNLTCRVLANIYDAATRKAQDLADHARRGEEVQQELTKLIEQTRKNALEAAPANKKEHDSVVAPDKMAVASGQEDWKELQKRIDQHMEQFINPFDGRSKYEATNPNHVAKRFQETANGLSALADAYDRVAGTRPSPTRRNPPGGTSGSSRPHLGLGGLWIKHQIRQIERIRAQTLWLQEIRSQSGR